MSRLVIKVEAFAGDDAPETAVKELAAMANRLQLWCEAVVNGIVVMAAPDDNPETLAGNFMEAARRKASYVSGNVIPKGVA